MFKSLIWLKIKNLPPSSKILQNTINIQGKELTTSEHILGDGWVDTN